MVIIPLIIMSKDRKIFIAGHSGLAGKAISHVLAKNGYSNLLTRTHDELDLTNQADTRDFFNIEQPDIAILAAAKVGGILENYSNPVAHIYNNLMMECNVINAAYEAGTRDILFLGSVCIYPKYADEPVKENSLLTGELEPTNEAYAVAKIAGIKLCEAYNRQFNTRYYSIMPANLYGPHDNFHPERSHVIPGLIRRFHDSKVNGIKDIEIWGTGTARREFLYSEDMANACMVVMNKYFFSDHTTGWDTRINVGVSQDISIGELVDIIKDVVGYRGNIVYNTNKPDGTKSRLMDSSIINELGWKPVTGLKEGIEKTYKWFVENHATVRL